MRKPNFNNILKVLRREAPDRPTLFEFFLNHKLYSHLIGCEATDIMYPYINAAQMTKAFAAAGYDYATVHGSEFHFPTGKREHIKTQSLNDNATIVDRASFDAYKWPSADDCDYTWMQDAQMPEGMKFMVCGPSGVLENTIALVGYDNLAMMIYDDPELVSDVFNEVGSRLLRHYELSVQYNSVGFIMVNDDWGFKTQPMLAPEDMRKYVIPWHKKIVAAAHNAGKPAVLHSCGNLRTVMDDIIDDIKFDGKHSYEDNIQPVEDAYREYGSRIAVLGGIDLDFIVSKTPDEVYARSKKMLELGQKGYALGTGNSVPEYVPQENYFAMTKAATEV